MTLVLTIGEILVEIVATTRGEGFLDTQPLLGPYPSGAPAIFIDQVGKTGAPAAIIGRVGSDDFGRVNLDRLARDGVDISGIEVASGECTGSAFVRYRPDGSRSFLYNIADAACGRIRPTAATEALVGRATHLHVVGTALSAPGLRAMVLDAAHRIKARGGTLSFDPNLRPEMLSTAGLIPALEEVLALTDIFMPSGEEIVLFANGMTEDEAPGELLARGIGMIVHKRGARGAVLHMPEGRVETTPIPVEERDPTGAGDTFGGAFVGFLMQGAPPGKALELANAAGARAVTFLGPMEGTATRDELEIMMAEAKA